MGLIILFGTKVRSLMNFVLKRKQDSKDSISTKSSIKLTGELIKDFKLIKNNKRYEAYFKVLTIAGLLILSYLLLFDWGHSVAIDSNLGNNNFTGSKGTSGALIVFIFWICAQLATLNFCNKGICSSSSLGRGHSCLSINFTMEKFSFASFKISSTFDNESTGKKK